MATPLEILQQRQDEDWLIGFHGRELVAIANHILATLTHWQTTAGRQQPPVILLAEPDPCRFLAGFIAACSFPCTVALCHPAWATNEWQQVIELVQPDWMLGQPQAENAELWSTIHQSLDLQSLEPYPFHPTPPQPPTPIPHPPSPSPLILIPTGGSSGTIRFAMHTWETLAASVAGFRQYFEATSVNSLCVLPLHHVSGLMQFLRSLLSGGTFAIVPFKTLLAGDCPPLPPDPFFFSLVPTQLHRLLQTPQSLPFLSPPPSPPHPALTLLLGGAPAWENLLAQARQRHLQVALTYGMTETASQIASLKPADFWQGRSRCGRVLPHAEVTIRDAAGNSLPASQIGRVVIRAKSLMLGYFPHCLHQPEFETEDLGFLDADGLLQIVGRRDGTIISGGENIFPAEVEAAIWQTSLVQDVCVIGLPDAEWGAAVTAVYVPIQAALELELKTAIAPLLSRYKHPKHWIAVTQLPRNAQGKINRPQVMAIAQQFLGVKTDGREQPRLN